MKTHVILTQKEWESFRPLLKSHNIPFSPSGYWENVYVGFEVDEPTRNKIDELLKQI